MARDSLVEDLIGLEEDADRQREIERMTNEQRYALPYHWQHLANPAQLPPPGDWHIWMIMAGRGFGKTRAGAEWVREIVEADPTARIALVGASLGDARRVMVEGPSGLLNIGLPEKRPLFEPSKRELRWGNGAIATLYSAGEPESLRGPQHSHAWCDEIGKWDHAGGKAEAAWSNLQLGLRAGGLPRVLATTTPRAVPLMKRLLGEQGLAITRGRTEDNKDNLAPGFLLNIRQSFGNSLLARQELDGEMIAEVEGALWSRALLERCRATAPVEPEIRVIVGVDPPASSHGDECGIVVAGLQEDGRARVIADCSIANATPEGWARAVANAAAMWAADLVVAEANQGGAMVASVLRAADINLPLKLVHASTGKSARAEPVAALYEAGRVTHTEMLAQLEDQLCGMMVGGSYEGPGRSPDCADALVWALTELLLGRRRVPRATGM